MWELTKQLLVARSCAAACSAPSIGVAARRGRRHRRVDVLRDVEEVLAEPEKFGTGHVEGIIESGAANNSALAGAWIPALVFGIPGDSITAIVIGVLYIKGMNPGPAMFMNNRGTDLRDLPRVLSRQPDDDPARLGVHQGRRSASSRCRATCSCRSSCYSASSAPFAINNTALRASGVILVFGVIAFFMEENGFPVAPAILGVSSARCSRRTSSRR